MFDEFQFVCSYVQLLEAGEDVTSQSIDRHLLWIEARRNKKGEIEHPPTREVAERIVRMIALVNVFICNFFFYSK